jgi:hypothetical protein
MSKTFTPAKRFLVFLNRLARKRANIAQTEYRGAVGYNSDQSAATRVFKGIVRILLDREAWLSYPGRVGKAQVALRAARFGGRNFNFSNSDFFSSQAL